MTSCWISLVPSKIVWNSVREEQGNLAAGAMTAYVLHRARNLCCIAARPHVEALIDDGAHGPRFDQCRQVIKFIAPLREKYHPTSTIGASAHRKT